MGIVIRHGHWNENVILKKKFSALEVVILTTSSATSDEYFIKMKTFLFQWSSKYIQKST